LASVKEQWNLTLRAWRESAPFWERHAAVIRAMFEPLSSSLIEAAGVGPDDLALDVASGVGEPALQIAATRKPALVVCTDAVREMVIAAKRVAARSGASNLGFAQCAAEALPFRSGRFDAVVCRLGAMFFTAPVASLREMLRVLAPGGRIALAVWLFARRTGRDVLWLLDRVAVAAPVAGACIRIGNFFNTPVEQSPT